MKEYVCGLAFTPGGKLVLIRKTHPAWQAGKHNGVGGLILADEPPADAMAREFEEEAGVHIPPDQWEPFLVLGDGRGWKVHFFAVETELARQAHTQTDEAIERKPVEWWLQFGYLIPNLRWIIPLAQQRSCLTLVDVREIPVAAEVAP